MTKRVYRKDTKFTVWDYLKAFEPPDDIGYGKPSIFKVEKLDPSSVEYRYVAFKFLQTLNGRIPDLNSISKTFKLLEQKGLQNAQRIIQIDKIYNSAIYERVE